MIVTHMYIYINILVGRGHKDIAAVSLLGTFKLTNKYLIGLKDQLIQLRVTQYQI